MITIMKYGNLKEHFQRVRAGAEGWTKEINYGKKEAIKKRYVSQAHITIESHSEKEQKQNTFLLSVKSHQICDESPFKLSLSTSVITHHYCLSHTKVAPFIVSEAAVITWQVAEKMFETMRSDNDKFVAYSLHWLVLVTECCFSNENGASEYSRQASHLPPTCCMQLMCYNCAASLFCFKEGGFVGKNGDMEI